MGSATRHCTRMARACLTSRGSYSAHPHPHLLDRSRRKELRWPSFAPPPKKNLRKVGELLWKRAARSSTERSRKCLFFSRIGSNKKVPRLVSGALLVYDLSYLTVTFAPAASRASFAFSATSFLTFSSTGFGAPSTRSLASFKPRLVRVRTSLMTAIF